MLNQACKDMLHEVCEKEGWEWSDERQTYSYTLYVEPGECQIDKKEGQTIQSSKFPRDEVVDHVFSAWEYPAIYVINNVLDIVKSRLSDEQGIEIDDEMQEEMEYLLSPEYPIEDYLQEEYEVNLVLDTGDQNTDYGENNFWPHYDSNGINDKISKESSLLWLIRQQGRTKTDLRRVFREIARTGKSEDKLLKSVHQEVANASSWMNAVTFLVTMTLEDILRINEAIAKRDEKGFQYDPSKRPHVGEIVIPKSCMCGLVDFWNGAGSVLEIELEKDVVLPLRYLRSADPDDWEHYSVSDVYGMCSSAWKTKVSVQLKEKKEGVDMPEFHETCRGREFYDYRLPALIKAIEANTAAINKLVFALAQEEKEKRT